MLPSDLHTPPPLRVIVFLALAGCFTLTEGSDGDTTLSEDPPAGWDDTGWGSDGGSSSGDGGNGSSDGGSSSDGGGGSNDQDNDGYPAGEDCNDDDPDINPGIANDLCDGVDEDCDDLIDEDFAPDSYESNDDSGGTDLGDMTDNTSRVTSYLSPETDEDTYLFYVEDGTWDWFEIWIDVRVPTDIDMVLELWWYPDSGGGWELVEVMDDGTLGRDESIDYGGAGGSDDSGTYGLIMYSAEGSSCDTSYIVEIEA